MTVPLISVELQVRGQNDIAGGWRDTYCVVTWRARRRVARWVAADQAPPVDDIEFAAKVVRSMSVVRPGVQRAWGTFLIMAAFLGLLFGSPGIGARLLAVAAILAYAMWQFARARRTEDALEWADRYLDNPSVDMKAAGPS